MNLLIRVLQAPQPKLPPHGHRHRIRDLALPESLRDCLGNGGFRKPCGQSVHRAECLHQLAVTVRRVDLRLRQAQRAAVARYFASQQHIFRLRYLLAKERGIEPFYGNGAGRIAERAGEDGHPLARRNYPWCAGKCPEKRHQSSLSRIRDRTLRLEGVILLRKPRQKVAYGLDPQTTVCFRTLGADALQFGYRVIPLH